MENWTAQTFSGNIHYFLSFWNHDLVTNLFALKVYWAFKFLLKIVLADPNQSRSFWSLPFMIFSIDNPLFVSSSIFWWITCHIWVILHWTYISCEHFKISKCTKSQEHCKTQKKKKSKLWWLENQIRTVKLRWIGV